MQWVSETKRALLTFSITTWHWWWRTWSPYMTMSLAALECSFSSSLSRIWRLVWKSHTSTFTLTLPRLAALTQQCDRSRVEGDLGLVELQFVVGDPPGLLGLQSLCSLLLHVILLQPVRLDQLLKSQLAAEPHRHITALRQCYQTHSSIFNQESSKAFCLRFAHFQNQFKVI